MSPILLTAIYIATPFLIIVLFNRCKYIQKIGTVMMAYLIGIILALTGAIPTETASGATEIAGIQNFLMNLTIPLAIPLMLFNANFKLWTKSLPKTLIALACGLVAIIIAVMISYYFFKDFGIEHIKEISALMTGIYTGGTVNFFSISQALQIDQNTLVIVLTFEMLATFPFIMFIVGGGYKLFRKLLPFPLESDSKSAALTVASEDFENYHDMLSWQVIRKMLLALMLSVACLAVGVGISWLLTGKLSEMIVILTITSLAILLSFSKRVRDLPKMFEMGMFFILLFSVVVASQFDFYSINYQLLHILGYILSILLIALLIHLFLCRCLKVNGDLFTVAVVGMFCSPPFIPPVVAAMKNKKVLISGIVIGLMGYAIGTYLGIAVFQWL